MTILEVIVAGTLVAAMAGLCLQMLSVAVAQRRAREDRQAALHEADNLMERIAAEPFEELTKERAGQWQLSEAVKARLTSAELSVEIDTPPDDPRAKRIAVSVGWQDRAGQTVKPVRVVAWRYGGGREETGEQP